MSGIAVGTDLYVSQHIHLLWTTTNAAYVQKYAALGECSRVGMNEWLIIGIRFSTHVSRYEKSSSNIRYQIF